MSATRLSQALRWSLPAWIAIALVAFTGQVGSAADHSRPFVESPSGTPNYQDALFGNDRSEVDPFSNAGYSARRNTDFGPAPSGSRDHDHAGHDHSDHADHDHAGHDHADDDHSGHDHSGHDHSGHDHSGQGEEQEQEQPDLLPSGGSAPLWQSRPAAPSPSDRAAPPAERDAPDAEPTGEELVKLRLDARYGDPVVERFIKGMSPNQFSMLVLETSRLIDARHVAPTSYEARAAQAVENLRLAIGNPQFRRVFGLSANPARQQAFVREMNRYASTQSVRNVNDFLRVMNGVAAIAQRQLGLSAGAVAAEFVYGATESLDKYSAFNPEAPRMMPSASTGLEDSVVGIGVEIKPHDQGVIVVKPVRGGPAAAAGVQRGDIITGVNGQNIAGRSLDYAVDLIGGRPGTPVRLQLLRNDRQVQLSLRRDRFRVYSVSDVQMLDSQRRIGYIKLDKFAESSTEELKQALWGLYRQDMESLVLDLRGNPGGLLTTAVEVSDMFLPRGTIVSTRGRTAEDNMQETAAFAKTWKIPMVVLIDENSASASEIFAAAIQDHRRGLIVGGKSYGKGTVQTHFPLSTVSGNLKITTARFFSPNGRKMAGAGVTPDVKVAETTADDQVVPLAQDPAVRKAVQVAAGQEVRAMATASENGRQYSSR